MTILDEQYAEFEKLPNEEIINCFEKDGRLYDMIISQQLNPQILDNLYRITNQIRSLSKSKTGSQFVQSLLCHKRAMLKPWRDTASNTLTNVLGGHAGPVQTEIQHIHLEQGDRLLLCSDGLTDMVSDAQIAQVLSRIQRSDQVCRALVDLALEAGGRDNITVVSARYSFPDESRT